MCVKALAFFNFLVDFFVAAMFFPLPFGLPAGRAVPYICKFGANVQSNASVNHLALQCGACNGRISSTRPRAPEITLNKSTYVEKFNLFERQTFTAASLGHKVGQVSSGTVA